MEGWQHGGNECPEGITRRAFVVGALAAGAFSMLPGCSGKSMDKEDQDKEADDGLQEGSESQDGRQDGQEDETGALRIAIDEPASIDPWGIADATGMQVASLLFCPLTYYDSRTASLTGLAAQSWEAADDASEFTFALRQGATFTNGELVTATSFKRAWQRLARSKSHDGEASANASLLSLVKGFDSYASGDAEDISGLAVKDDLTLVVTLTQPQGDFPYIASHPALAPVPKTADTDAGFATFPVGNGPFALSAPWEEGVGATLVRNESYGYASPYSIASVEFVVVDVDEDAWEEFITGELDLVSVPEGCMSEVAVTYGESSDGYTINPGGQMLLGPTRTLGYLACNLSGMLTGRKAMRLAISHAIDRMAICRESFSGALSPATGFVPPGVYGRSESALKDELAYDEIICDNYLEDAGYSLGEDLPALTLGYVKGNVGEDLAVAIKGYLESFGIPCELAASESEGFSEKVATGEFDLACCAFSPDVPTMGAALRPLFYTGGGSNLTGFSDEDVDLSIDAAGSLSDESERVTAFREIEKAVGAVMPIVPLVFGKHCKVGSARIHDMYLGPDNIFDLSSCTLDG